jgi:hypothetical protein
MKFYTTTTTANGKGWREGHGIGTGSRRLFSGKHVCTQNIRYIKDGVNNGWYWGLRHELASCHGEGQAIKRAAYLVSAQGECCQPIVFVFILFNRCRVGAEPTAVRRLSGEEDGRVYIGMLYIWCWVGFSPMAEATTRGVSSSFCTFVHWYMSLGTGEMAVAIPDRRRLVESGLPLQWYNSIGRGSFGLLVHSERYHVPCCRR